MFTIGQKVRVRQWDDMAEEFGLNDYGNIPLLTDAFVTDMQEHCGKVYTIQSFAERDHVYLVGDVGWSWTIQMLEPIEVKGWKIGEVVKIGNTIAHVTGFTWDDKVKLSNGNKIDVNAQVERADTKGILVGDYVKIRSWDSMKKEFGVTGRHICTSGFAFIDEMKKFCGLVGRVSNIQDSIYVGVYEVTFSDNPVLQLADYHFNLSMVKKVKNWESVDV